MFRLLFGFISYSTRSFGGCLTGILMCFAALFVGQWLITAAVGAVSALSPAALLAAVGLGVGVLLLPPPWRAIVVAASVALILIVPAAPFGLLVVVLPAAWLGHRFGAGIRPRSRGARWATLRELWREGFLTPPYACLAAQGWPLGRWLRGPVLRLPAAREREGVLVVAQTGTGKTAGVLVPAIVAEADRPAEDLRSLVILDPKDEPAHLTRPTLAATHRTLVWDPSRPQDCSVRYDPLALLPSPADPAFIDEVRYLADAWADTTREGDYSTDPIWKTMARHFMRGVMLTYLDRHPGGGFIGLGEWVRSLTYGDLLLCVQQAFSRYVAAFEPTMRSVGLNDRMAGSVFSDIQHRFEILDTPHIHAAMAPGQTVDWEAFVNTPTALFLKVPARDAHQLGALLSLFMAQAYRALTAIAARHPGNTLPREVRILIDELGNLPRIHQIENALSTMRSYGVGHLLVIQTRSQLAMTYGVKLAQSIQDNLVTNVVLGGAADEDARWFSNRCGQRTQYHRRATHSLGMLPFRGGGASIGYEPDTRPLIAPEEITHLTGAVFVSTHGLPPIRCRLRPYFRERRLP